MTDGIHTDAVACGLPADFADGHTAGAEAARTDIADYLESIGQTSACCPFAQVYWEHIAGQAGVIRARPLPKPKGGDADADTTQSGL